MTQTAPTSPEREEQIELVLVHLVESYGHRTWRRHHGPLDELIATVLSQHTSDTNTARAFASLKQAFLNWGAVQAAPVKEVAEAIRMGGLANTKAPRIQAILAAIARDRGSHDLAALSTMPLDDARRWLLGLPGVGPKTAACVLLFSLGRPTLPVDTHVHRVSLRLGLIDPRTSAEAAHEVLERALGDDRDRVYDFHLTMIAHGRAVCVARRPRCERCSLTENCDYFTNLRRSGADHPPARPARG